MVSQETLGYKLETTGVTVVVPIHDDRDDELVALDTASALARQRPFLAEETFLARLSSSGNQWKEPVAAVDGVLDLLLPVVAGAQFAFVEPGHVGADVLQVGEDLACRRQVFGA